MVSAQEGEQTWPACRCGIHVEGRKEVARHKAQMEAVVEMMDARVVRDKLKIVVSNDDAAIFQRDLAILVAQKDDHLHYWSPEYGGDSLIGGDQEDIVWSLLVVAGEAKDARVKAEYGGAGREAALTLPPHVLLRLAETLESGSLFSVEAHDGGDPQSMGVLPLARVEISVRR